MPKFIFFWKADSPFSQWYPSEFTAIPLYVETERLQFSCAEQWMMYNKALLFEDTSTAEEIILTTNPKKIKSLGRKVKGFNDEKWVQERERIVKTGNLHKFSQSESLRRVLLSKKGRFVEASPYDRVWGIGLEESHPHAKNPQKWKGLNLLGDILTEVRDELAKERVS